MPAGPLAVFPTEPEQTAGAEGVIGGGAMTVRVKFWSVEPTALVARITSE